MCTTGPSPNIAFLWHKERDMINQRALLSAPSQPQWLQPVDDSTFGVGAGCEVGWAQLTRLL